MKRHPYARARDAYTEAEEILVQTAVPEGLWPLHLVRRILAELRRPHPAEGSTFRAPLPQPEAVEADAAALWERMRVEGMAEDSGVRFLLAEDGHLLLENASRVHGSPETAIPSSISCGGLTDEVLCNECVDLHHPCASAAERAHRERVRAHLARAEGAGFSSTWDFLLGVVATHLPGLAPLLSRATPLRLHLSGYFCATTGSDEDCQALMRKAREVELLLVAHGVPALGYRMGLGWEPGTFRPVPLRSCDVLHLP